MSTGSNPAALFAEPTLHINGRYYAAASPRQFCVYPTPFPAELLLRRIITPGLGSFGPIFWASPVVPAGFELASQLQGILTLNETDAITQADVATLSNWSALPCDLPSSSGSLKCEAIVNGYNLSDGANFELSHYRVPGTQGDVIVYRSTRGILNLHASVRETPDGPWHGQNLTDFPDDNANLNAGALPDGRAYVLSNSMPNWARDPLFLSTAADGLNFSATTPLTSCGEAVYTAADQPWGCAYRYQGGSKQSGVQYPQGLPLTAAGVEGFWAIYSLNKEDIWVLRAPFASLA